MGGIKAEKLKSWIASVSRSDQLNLCVVGATSLLMLCACALQLRALSGKMTPTLFTFWSSHLIDTPPESECYSSFTGVIYNPSPLYN
jgi:hypothetical protein